VFVLDVKKVRRAVVQRVFGAGLLKSRGNRSEIIFGG
jgi:hypothetical protein